MTNADKGSGSRGIYILANDPVIDNTIALLNSIRFYDPDIPIIMIPYDRRCRAVSKVAADSYGVGIYEDGTFLKRLTEKSRSIFGRDFFIKPNNLLKLACWLGPFDEFLYLDTDIVVFEKIGRTMDYLNGCDLVCCDYQYLNGMKYVFTEKVLKDNIFSNNEIKKIFNPGFWCSKKGLFQEDDLYEALGECSSRRDWFDFSLKVSDMPILNYIVLKYIKRILNIAGVPEEKAAGNWAGSPQFRRQGDKLIDTNVNKPLKFLHWAGIQIKPGCPYWDIWKHYRYLDHNVKR